MQSIRPAPPEPQGPNSMPVLPQPVQTQRASFGRRDRDHHPALRQVEEFSSSLRKIRRTGYLSAATMLLLTLICVALFLRNIDVIAFFSAGAMALLIQLAITGIDYFHEEKRAAQAYWKYLDTFSYQVLVNLRKTSQLTDWSRYEIDRYLSVPHLKW